MPDLSPHLPDLGDGPSRSVLDQIAHRISLARLAVVAAVIRTGDSLRSAGSAIRAARCHRLAQAGTTAVRVETSLPRRLPFI